MRVTLAHGKTQKEAIRIVDASFDDIFKGLPVGPVQITNQHRSWNGNVMKFGLTAKMGFLQNPVQGTVEVTARDITIDADLGMLEALVSRSKIQNAVEGSIRKLLPGPSGKKAV